LAGNNEKLIGELRIKADKLIDDVKKINQELAKINQGKDKINLDIGVTDTGKELEKFAQKYKAVAGESQKLVQETRILTTEYGKQIKTIDQIDEKTGKVSRTTKILTEDYKKQREEVDKLANKIGEFREKSAIKTSSNDRKLELIQNAEINKSLEKDFNDRKIKQREISDESRKLTYQDEQQRLRTTTESQKSIERFILNSNETISEQQRRIDKRDAFEYEQIWQKAIKDVEQRKIQDDQKLGSQMGSAREKYMAKLHDEALLINKQIDAEASKRKLASEKQVQLELKNQEKIIQDRKKIETEYEQWWLRSLKERELKEEQSIRKIAQQQALQAEKVSNSQFQSALTARQGVSLFGGTNTMGSGDARASVSNKVLNSAIYTASYYGLTALTTTVSQAIQTNKQYELGLNDLSRTLNNVTNSDLKAYGKEAIQFAKDFAVPLDEVQKAMTELARAGVDNKTDLEAMTKSVLTGLNTTEIKDATAMTGYLVSAVKQLGMNFQDSMKIIDSWNKLADKYAVQSNDFAEAIQKAGSASKSLGLDINDVNAMVVMLGEATQSSGSEIGDALKSLEVRLLNPKTVETLESYGIAVKKDAEHFLSFKEIMNNIDQGTKNLTDDSTQLNDIMSALGGTWRRNWAHILTADWGRFEQLSKESVESFGYSIKENEKVLQTFDAQIKKFQAAMAEVFVSMGQDGGILDQLKGILQGASSVADAFAKTSPELKNFLVIMVEVTLGVKLFSMAMKGLTGVGISNWLSAIIQNLGVFNNVQRTSAQVTNMLNAALNTGKITQQEYSIIMEMVNTKLGVANVSTKALNTAQQAMAATQRGLMLSTIALNVALGAGILIITGLFTAFASYNAKQEEMKQNAKDTAQKMQQEADALKNLKSQYASIIKSGDLTAESKTQLKSIQDELIKTYGIEAKSLDLVNGKYRDQVKLIDQAIVNRAKSQLASMGSTGEEARNALQQVDTSNFSTERLGGRISDNYNLQKIFNNNAVKNTDTNLLLNRSYWQINGTLEQRVEILKKLKLELDAVSNKDTNTLNIISAVSNEYNKLNDELQKNKTALDKYVQNKNIADFYDSFKDNISQVNNLLMASKKYPLDKDISVKLNNLKDSMQKVAESKGRLADFKPFIDDLFNNSSNIDKTNSGLKKITSNFKDLETAFNNSTNKIRDYKDILNDLNNKNGISDSVLKNITKDHKDLIPYLGNEIELRKKIAELVGQEEKAQKQAYINMQMASQDFYNSKIAGTNLLQKNLGEFYREDLEKYKTLAEAKDAVETELIKGIKDKWSSFYDVQTESFTQQFRDFKNTAPTQVSAEIEEKIKVNIDKLRDARKRFDNIVLEADHTNFSKINVGNVTKNNPSNSNNGSAPKTLTQQEIIDQSKLVDAFIKSANAQSKVTEQANKHLEVQIKIADKQKNYNKEIELTNKLIAGQKKEISNLQLAQEKMSQKANSIRNAAQNKKYNTESWFDENGDSTSVYDTYLISFTQRKNKLIQKMNGLESKDKLSKTEKERLVDLKNQVNTLDVEKKKVEDLFDSVQRLKKGWFDNESAISSMNDSIDESKQKIQDLKDTMKSEAKDLATQIVNSQKSVDESALNSYTKVHQSRLDGYQSELDALKLKNDLLQTQEDTQQKLLDIQKAQISLTKAQQKLDNIQNNKNVQILQKQFDGRYQYSYVADTDAIKSAQDEVKSAQEALLSAQKSYDQQLVKNQENSLQRKIDAERVLIDNAQKVFDTHYANVDGLVDKMLEGVGTTAIDIQNTINKWKVDLAQLKQGGVVSSDVSKATGVYYSSNTGSTISSSTIAAVGEVASKAIEFAKKSVLGIAKGLGLVHDKGGKAIGKGLIAKDIIEPERVLSPQQTKSFDRLVDIMDRSPELRIPVNSSLFNFPINTPMNNNSQPLQQTFQIDRLELPNVTNGEEFIASIKNQLPLLALQKSK
jgi:TP901 family phage tail tape measure protein